MIDLPLRERKYAATKAALMDAVLARLATQALDDIAVKDVCGDVPVSETTFFNYFPSKLAVIAYRVQLWSIAVTWHMRECLSHGAGHLGAIRSMFDLTAEQAIELPGFMGEVVAFHGQAREKLVFTPLTLAEYAHHFPNKAGIEAVEAAGIDQLLTEQLRAALRSGELPTDTDLPALGLTLLGVFFFTPITLPADTDMDVKTAYCRQLDQLLPDEKTT